MAIKTYDIDTWNNLERYFTEEGRSAEECEQYRKLVWRLDHREDLDDLREHRRHDFLDAFDAEVGDESEIGTSMKHLSRDAYEYKNGLSRASAEAVYVQKYIRRLIRETILQLKPTHRDVIIAVFYKGLSLTEYSLTVGITPQAASQRLIAAKKKIKPLLKDALKDIDPE